MPLSPATSLWGGVVFMCGGGLARLQLQIRKHKTKPSLVTIDYCELELEEPLELSKVPQVLPKLSEGWCTQVADMMAPQGAVVTLQWRVHSETRQHSLTSPAPDHSLAETR